MLLSAPLAVIARGVLLSIWLKKLSILRKIHFFFEKIVEKICTYQKNVVPLHRQTKTNNNSKHLQL